MYYLYIIVSCHYKRIIYYGNTNQHGKQLYTASAVKAEQVHDAIEKAFPEVKHCMVHVNPASHG